MMYIKKFSAIKSYRIIRITIVSMRDPRTSTIYDAVITLLLIDAKKICEIQVELLRRGNNTVV